MTDRELLELAAKAAGYAFRVEITPIGIDVFYVDGYRWNPLRDGGDALRLAVKLKLKLKFSGEWVVCEEGTYKKYGSIRAEELNTQDPYAATRRAIVLASAKIGKVM